MYKKIILVVTLATFITANISYAQSNPFYDTVCRWFSSCNNSPNTNVNTNNSNQNQNLNNNYQIPTSFPLPAIFSGNGINSFFDNVFNTDNKIDTKILDPINKDNKSSNVEEKNNPNKSDFLGVNKDAKDSENSSRQLLTDNQVKEERRKFEICQKNSNDSLCKTDIRLANQSGQSNQGQGNENVSGLSKQEQAYIDSKTGSASPNYDSGEDIETTQGPPLRGPNDSTISKSTKSFNAKDIFVGPGTGACSNYGMTVGGSCPDTESYVSGFKIATANFCRLTGKKVIISSGNRSSACNARVGGASGSAHTTGKAMDTAFSGLSESEKTIAFLYFLGQGYDNVGGYNAAGPIHMDMRDSSTRWGPNYSYSSCESALFPNYTRVGFNLMGLSPCARNSSAPAKARAALESMGKSEFAKKVTGLGV